MERDDTMTADGPSDGAPAEGARPPLRRDRVSPLVRQLVGEAGTHPGRDDDDVDDDYVESMLERARARADRVAEPERTDPEVARAIEALERADASEPDQAAEQAEIGEPAPEVEPTAEVQEPAPVAAPAEPGNEDHDGFLALWASFTEDEGSPVATGQPEPEPPPQEAVAEVHEEPETQHAPGAVPVAAAPSSADAEADAGGAQVTAGPHEVSTVPHGVAGASGWSHSEIDREERDDDAARMKRILLIAGLVLLVLLLLGAARQVLAARAELLAAVASADTALLALRAARLEDAAEAFTQSEDGFATARARVRSPLVRTVGMVPYAGRQLGAVESLAAAGGGSARAGRVVLAGLASAGGVDDLLPRAGALPVGTYAGLLPELRTATGLLRRASTTVEGVPTRGLARPVVEARAEAAERLGEAVALVDDAEPLVAALPALLGADGPRRYFFAASNPAELRGSTGFVGAFSILTLDEGRFEFSDFRPIQDLADAPPEAAPPPPNEDFLPRYARFGGTGVWRNLSVSPDFPSVGIAIERLWDATTDQPPVDGVIAADPFLLAALAQITGPIPIPTTAALAPGDPGIGAVDPDDVVDFLSNEAYARILDAEARKRLLGDVAAATVQAFLGATADADRETALAVARSIGEAAQNGHLLIHARDPEVQEGIRAAGLAGAVLDPPGDYVATFFDGTTSSKIDYYLERELDYRVDLRPDGTLDAQAELRLHNRAPTEGTAYVIGPNVEGLVAGENRVYAGAFLDSDVIPSTVAVTRDGGQIDAGALQREADHPIVETFESLRSGERVTLGYTYANPDGWSVGEDGLAHYRLTLQAQAAITPQRVTVEVALPPGATPLDLDPAVEVNGDHVVYKTDLFSTQRVDISFAMP